MFGFIKNNLKKVYNQFTTKVHALFSREHLDEQTLQELEKLLLAADTGVSTTRGILDSLRTQFNAGTLKAGSDLHDALKKELLSRLQTNAQCANAQVFVLVGINGSGKTTLCGKLANRFAQQNKKVLLVAADTFRAAATEQLEQWAARTNTEIVTGTQGQDPASVVYAGCEKFNNENFDVLIIDTAGRLQTKTNLMRELEKIKKIITRQLPNAPTCTLLTIDAMLGQNSFEQARLFNESTDVSGVALTKMDGTGKGGIVFHIAAALHIPVAFVSFGEGIEDLKEFDPTDYVNDLLTPA